MPIQNPTIRPKFIDLTMADGRRVLINVLQITAIYEEENVVCIRTADDHSYYFNDSLTEIVRKVLLTVAN